MNDSYSYDSHQISLHVINKIYYFMELRGWSVKTLSDRADIPYETLKKILSRKVENTSIHNILKIASALQCRVDDLVSDNSISGYHTPPVHLQHLMQYLSEVETSLNQCISHQTLSHIAVYHPLSATPSGDYSKIPFLDAKALKQCYFFDNTPPDYGIYIDSPCYHPIFQIGDILLAARDRPPRSGEIGVFLHGGYVYIRRYLPSYQKIILHPINGIGTSIELASLADWEIFGHIVGVHRNSSYF